MFPEKYKIVPVLSDGDLNAGASLSCDSINMKNYHDATFIVGFQTIGVAATYVLLYSGATDAALTSALTFRYAFGGAATGTAVAGSTASSDVLAAWATSANLSVAHATYDNYMLIIHILATEMDLANNEDWLTLTFADTDTGATGNVQVHAVLTPRYACSRSETALA